MAMIYISLRFLTVNKKPIQLNLANNITFLDNQ